MKALCKGYLTGLAGFVAVAAACFGLSLVDTADAGCRVVLSSRGGISHRHGNNVVVLKQVVADQYYSVGAAIQEEALADRIAAKVEARLLARSGTVQASDVPPDPQPALDSALVQRACVRCHNAQHPDRLDLTDLSALSCEDRLEAVRRVVSDDPGERMPKGVELQPGEIGSVLQELSR